MDPTDNMTDLEPAQLDPWLREHLGRRMVVAGFTMPAITSATAITHARAGVAPAPFIAALSNYSEIWVLWAAVSTTIDDALAQAAAHDADAVVIWLLDASGLPPLAPDAASVPIMHVLRATVAAAESMGVCDRAMLALAGPGATRAFARRLGFEDGFAIGVPPARIAVTLARAAVARAGFARQGSSPPCYL